MVVESDGGGEEMSSRAAKGLPVQHTSGPMLYAERKSGI